MTNPIQSFPFQIPAENLRSVAPKVFARKIIILNERRRKSDPINAIPYLLRLKRLHLRTHRSLYILDAIRRGTQTRVKQTNHVIARRAICKNNLIRDVDEEGQRVRCLGRAVELRVCTRGPGLGAAAAVGRGAGVWGVGDGTVGVACGVKGGRVRGCAVSLCSLDRAGVVGRDQEGGYPFEGCRVVA